MIANSSPPVRQTSSLWRTARAELDRQLGEHLVADGVTVDVVDPLEVVEVEHHERDGARARTRRERPRSRRRSWNARWFQSPVERIGLRLELEAGPHLGVVERERRRVAESHGELELVLGELAAVRRDRC